MPGDWKGRRAPIESESIPYGSSRAFADWLRDEKPWLLAAEGSITCLDGSPSWEPASERFRLDRLGRPTCRSCDTTICERPDAAPAVHRIGASNLPPCPRCRDRIGPGSLLYCPHCGTSGFDRPLAAQLRIVGYPPPEPEKAAPPRAIPLPPPGTGKGRGRRKSSAAPRRSELKGGLP